MLWRRIWHSHHLVAHTFRVLLVTVAGHADAKLRLDPGVKQPLHHLVADRPLQRIRRTRLSATAHAASTGV
ncbi:MAG TPA: hypothetical protein VF456_11650 [Vicinamibacterales bacterium]